MDMTLLERFTAAHVLQGFFRDLKDDLGAEVKEQAIADFAESGTDRHTVWLDGQKVGNLSVSVAEGGYQLVNKAAFEEYLDEQGYDGRSEAPMPCLETITRDPELMARFKKAFPEFVHVVRELPDPMDFIVHRHPDGTPVDANGVPVAGVRWVAPQVTRVAPSGVKKDIILDSWRRPQFEGADPLALGGGSDG